MARRPGPSLRALLFGCGAGAVLGSRPWPAGPVRLSGPCCLAVAQAPFWVRQLGFLVGSESNVRGSRWCRGTRVGEQMLVSGNSNVGVGEQQCWCRGTCMLVSADEHSCQATSTLRTFCTSRTLCTLRTVYALFARFLRTLSSLGTLCTVRTLTWRACIDDIDAFFDALFTHFLRTFYALLTHFLRTFHAPFTHALFTHFLLFTHCLLFSHFLRTFYFFRTFYALFTHFLHTFYTLFAHFLRTFYVLYALYPAQLTHFVHCSHFDMARTV